VSWHTGPRVLGETSPTLAWEKPVTMVRPVVLLLVPRRYFSNRMAAYPLLSPDIRVLFLYNDVP